MLSQMALDIKEANEIFRPEPLVDQVANDKSSMNQGIKNSVVAGVGSYVPEMVLDNQKLSQKVETSDEWIQTRTGITERRIASNEQTTSDLAFFAAQRAIESAKIDPGQIDLVIVATITPDMAFPSTACLLQHKLGLGKVACFDLEAACSGFLYALDVADGMLASGRYKCVLVIGAEKMSSILDWEDRTTCVLFGDGAGAAILRVEGDAQLLGFALELMVPIQAYCISLQEDRRALHQLAQLKIVSIS